MTSGLFEMLGSSDVEVCEDGFCVVPTTAERKAEVSEPTPSLTSATIAP